MKGFTLKCALFLTLVAGGAVSAAGQHPGSAGAVYVMTNDAAANHVVYFDRDAAGALKKAGEVSTGGLGSGGGLGNQGALVLSNSGRWLLAVNAGSNELSVFKVGNRSLSLADKQLSGGIQPISVTIHGDLVYVLNEGGAGNISGFRLSEHGKLSPISGSTQPLNGVGTDPAQIGFHPSGRILAVTVKDTNEILLYTVDRDGRAGAPTAHASSGPTPFGFAFGKRGQLFVSEAAGGNPNAGSTSSYHVSADGELSLITPSAPANGTAACWLVVTGDGRRAITANTPSNTLSTYGIDFDGSISLAGTTPTGAGTLPQDSALTSNSRYLYVLNTGTDDLSAFQLVSGDLVNVPLEGVSLPASANGIAAR